MKLRRTAEKLLMNQLKQRALGQLEATGVLPKGGRGRGKQAGAKGAAAAAAAAGGDDGAAAAAPPGKRRKKGEAQQQPAPAVAAVAAAALGNDRPGTSASHAAAAAVARAAATGGGGAAGEPLDTSMDAMLAAQLYAEEWEDVAGPASSAGGSGIVQQCSSLLQQG